jgi:hypothetical protein
MSRWDDDLPGQWEIETTYPDYAPHAFIKSPWLEVKEKEKGSGRYSKYKIELVPSEPLPLP